MSFWKNPGKSISNIVHDPWKSISGAVEDTAEDIYNVTTQTPGKVLGAVTGSDKVKRIAQPPTWDDLGTPGEAFYNNFNESAGILPPSWRQYAAPVVGTALNFVPGVGPLLSAGFNTAYNAGAMQANQKGMDWGKVGIDAAKNVGTAALAMGAQSLASGAKAAQASSGAANAVQTAASSPSLAANYAGIVGQSVGSGTGAGLGSAIPQGFNLARTGSAVPSASALSQFKSYNAPAGNTSQTSVPEVSARTSNGLSTADKIYNSAIQPVSTLASNALTSTLAPEGSTALSGFDAAGTTGGSEVDGYKFGDVLNAFGNQADFNTPNPTGRRIDAADLDNMTMNVGYNNYMQQQGARDTYLPAGQTEPTPNTPYANKLEQIGASTNKSYEDLLREVDNYNAYYGIMDANPGITEEDMNKYISDPSLVPSNMQQYFQGIQPMSMFNTSLIR